MKIEKYHASKYCATTREKSKSDKFFCLAKGTMGKIIKEAKYLFSVIIEMSTKLIENHFSSGS